MGIVGMRINSIFTYIALIFCVAIISLNSILFSTMRYYELTVEYQEHQNDVKALRLIDALRLNGFTVEQINKQLFSLNITLVEKPEEIVEKSEILNNYPYGKLLKHNNEEYIIFYRLPPPIQPVSPIPFLTSLSFEINGNKQNLAKMSQAFSTPIVIQKLNTNIQNNNSAFLTLFFLINIGMFLIFMLIVKKLTPILSIRKAIKLYGEGKLDARSHIQGYDEIAFVGIEFDKTADKINALIDARVLFLRNLLHELKTPITTARLTAALVTDDKTKNRLDSAFERIDSVINNSVIMEKLASGFIEPNFQKYDLQECVYESIARSSKIISVNIYGSTKWCCDKELMVIAIKNLLENGIKHGKKNSVIHIHMNDQEFEVKSYGDPLKMEFENYLVPFNQKNGSSNGLGLGLWLVSQIMKLHNSTFNYRYENGQNIFSFNLKCKNIMNNVGT